MRQNDAGEQPTRRSLSTLDLRCPPLPQTLIEALELIDRPEKIEIGPVTEMVQRDPIVVARLLHTVNSAYYGLRHRIGSADRAVVMLGPVAVAGIVLGMHMLKLRSAVEGPPGACFERLIRHSLATAFLARHLMAGTSLESRRKHDPSPIGAAFTAGLLHDFGKIILIFNFHEDAHKLYDENALDDQLAFEDDRQSEQLIFGCDHTEAGEFAARKLNFPDVLIDVIRNHHVVIDSRATDASAGLAGESEGNRLVYAAVAANLASKAMGYSFGRSEEAESLEQHPIWNRLREVQNFRGTSPEAMVRDLLAQQKALDQYVADLTADVLSTGG